MATSTVSGFLPRRKQSVSNGFGAESHHLNLPASMVPPTASPGPATFPGNAYPFGGGNSSGVAGPSGLPNGHGHVGGTNGGYMSGTSTPGLSNASTTSLVSGSTIVAPASTSIGSNAMGLTAVAGSSSSADGGIGASLIPGAGPGGAPLQAGAPQAANNMINKQAGAGSSLYQSCLMLRDRLWRVDGFGPAYLSENSGADGKDGEDGGSASPITDSYSPNGPPSPKSRASSSINGTQSSSRSPAGMSDPVTQLWQLFRLGSPLCVLLNQLLPADQHFPTSVPTATAVTAPDGTPAPSRNNANECKKLVAKFIMALKTHLGFNTEEIFTISQLYLNDTNGFVRVIRTVSKVLDAFQERGLLVPSQKPAYEDEIEAAAGGSKPVDERARVVRELLDTERKYVMDLETLQAFAKSLSQNAILPADTIHNLFGNLNTMVDVQRRFLICVEENARRPVDDQHFGHVFRTMERDFTVYEPFCANYAQALDIISAEASNIMRMRGMPNTEDCYLEPVYELPTFLIKPVQRICKYHLILDSLIKRSAPDAPYLDELRDGYSIIKGVADRVNETRRLQENAQLVQELSTRVEDWKGHNILTFGHLLLSDVFMVAKGDTDREYHVYLFEKILLCCKEVQPNVNKKNSKSNSLLKQKSGQMQQPGGKKSKTTLLLKGRIFINNVTGAFANNKMTSATGLSSGQHSLQVWWRGDYDQESFSLRCKNEEQLKQWQTALNKLIEDVQARRQQLAAQYGAGGVSPSGNMAGTWALGRRITQTQSHFPQTPVTEQGGFFPLTRTESQAGYHSGEDVFDDDKIEGLREEGAASHDSFSGRGTPLGGRLSQPAETRDRKLSLSHEMLRPRAQTADQDSATMSQWRAQAGVPPPVPRQNSVSATTSAEQTLRKASSSRQLRQPVGYAAQGFSGYPRPPRQGNDVPNGEAADASVFMNEAADRTVTPGSAAPQDDKRGSAHSRSRSASNPQAFHLPATMQHLRQQPQQLRASPASTIPSKDQARSSSSQGGPSMLSYLASDAREVDKRLSSSSVSTVDSVRSARSRPDSTTGSSPITRSGSSGGSGVGSQPSRPSINAQAGSNVIKLIVQVGEDRFTQAVFATISFDDLVLKVANKVRVCAGRGSIPESGIKLRYIDEDGDRIIMKNNDDVQMAFEGARLGGGDVHLIVS
ncbi:hypothetical protein K437DRAFT_3872 [Tilletiaria anomala UBC 951]|uniref:DH domain-containing protein n=1 Tax=Tilletiaria anomala (strain ATCC 24038 / CBS 436.72 / UBC 951) TaxID=1037660 RepID=A0A066WHY3_TILAU|nr:uncharacterized protein K437DRAFT_3872 [Tilletiaria anomala UBC 951]KDN53627.1 hypothetical protein K437DRAFT_3872 [Tilletiaria anomala UBC 951]